jgi:WD40 repeat protein
MKDCTKLLFQEDDQFADTDTASTTPRSGFMRRLSVATDTEDVDQASPRQWGHPTVMAVNGMIAVGTESGWVAVMDFKQELKRVCGTGSTGQSGVYRVSGKRDLIYLSTAKSSGAVTAIAISPDATFVAVGHQSGSVFLYELASKSARPTRTAPALPAAALSSGRKEGHLIGTAITHLAFVGRRHTAIVTGDESGRAFWWSLGKVVGVESNDVIRLLGTASPASRPANRGLEPGTAFRTIGDTSNRASRDQDLFAASPLPVGSEEHPSDNFGMIALLTGAKLVIAGLKPSARTLYRRSRQADGGRFGKAIGCAAWLPTQRSRRNKPSDPVLAYSWGNQLRFLKIQITSAEKPELVEAKKASNYPVNRAEFVEGRIWREDSPIVGLNWLNSTVSPPTAVDWVK